MIANQNSTPDWVYAVWASALAIAIAVVGFHYHPPLLAYGVAGGIWGIGIAYMVVQIIKGGDTTLAPYVVQTLGAVVFIIWAAS